MHSADQRLKTLKHSSEQMRVSAAVLRRSSILMSKYKNTKTPCRTLLSDEILFFTLSGRIMFCCLTVHRRVRGQTSETTGAQQQSRTQVETDSLQVSVCLWFSGEIITVGSSAPQTENSGPPLQVRLGTKVGSLSPAKGLIQSKDG